MHLFYWQRRGNIDYFKETELEEREWDMFDNWVVIARSVGRECLVGLRVDFFSLMYSFDIVY